MHKLFFLFIIFSHSIHSQSIFDLARSGTVDEMKTYLNKNPEHLNLISEHGSSPFLLAAYRGNNAVATLLIEKGADLTYCYGEGSAIYALIYKNNLELIEEVLKKGVNVNDTCQFEQLGYPIHFAMTLKRYEVIKLLLENTIDLDVKDQQSRTISQLLSLYNDPKLYELFP
jgi:ankyrin repeat protein